MLGQLKNILLKVVSLRRFLEVQAFGGFQSPEVREIKYKIVKLLYLVLSVVAKRHRRMIKV
jgi:hypothetical protein